MDTVVNVVVVVAVEVGVANVTKNRCQRFEIVSMSIDTASLTCGCLGRQENSCDWLDNHRLCAY